MANLKLRSFVTLPTPHNTIQFRIISWRLLNAAKWWYIITFWSLSFWMMVLLLSRWQQQWILASAQMAFKMFTLSRTFTVTVLMRRKMVTVMLYSGVLIRNRFGDISNHVFLFVFLFCFDVSRGQAVTKHKSIMRSF